MKKKILILIIMLLLANGTNAKTLKDIILDKNGGQEFIDSKELINYKTNLQNDSFNKIPVGMYRAEDDYGMSYYYFNNDNNFENRIIKFGDFYWLLLRITGDGSLKLLYIDEAANVNDMEMNVIGAGNFNSKIDNKKYGGYIYDDNTDSDAKKVVDAWYKENIEDKGLTRYLSDIGFCGDRDYIEYLNEYDKSVVIFYGGFRKLQQGFDFKCPNKEDNYTVNDINKGNGKLKYPVGLISLNEIFMSEAANPIYKDNLREIIDNDLSRLIPDEFNGGGFLEVSNKIADLQDKNLLQKAGNVWMGPTWSMTPYAWYKGKMSVMSDVARHFWADNHDIGYRPVIHLKGDVEVTTKQLKGEGIYEVKIEELVADKNPKTGISINKVFIVLILSIILIIAFYILRKTQFDDINNLI